MKSIKITKADITIAPNEEVQKIFDKAGRSEEGRKAYEDEMELYHFMKRIDAEQKRKRLTNYAAAKKAAMNPFVFTRAKENINDAKFSSLSKMASGVGMRVHLVLEPISINTQKVRIMKTTKHAVATDRACSLRVLKLHTSRS